MKPHLLHILWDGQLGGTQRCVLELTRHIDLEKFHLTIAILSRGGPMTDQIDRTKVQVVEFGCTGAIDIIAFIRFYRFLKTRRFSIIHSHIRSILMNVVFYIIRPRPSLVCHEHGGELLGGSGGYFRTRLFYYLFSGYYDVFIAIHKEMVKRIMQYIKGPDNKIVVIENAIDVEKFSPSGDVPKLTVGLKDFNTIGTIARLVPEKDVALFVETAKLIIGEKSNIQFVVVGFGPLREELEDHVTSLNLTDSLTFIDGVSNVSEILRSFDLFIFTSRIEPFGLTIIESQACGIPVVAALPVNGGARDLLKRLPGVSLVNQRTPKEIASAAIDLLEDKDRLNLLSKSGRNYIEKHFSIEIWVSALDELYQRLLRLSNSIEGDVR